MVGENQVGRILLKFADECLSRLNSYGSEGEAVLAQFAVYQHHIAGVVFQDQDAQFFVHNQCHSFSSLEGISYPVPSEVG